MSTAPKPRILIVEDNRPALAALGKLIGESGWEVVQASTGFQAAAHLHSGVAPPDVILLDLMIPEPPGVAIVRMVRDMGLRSRATGRPVRVIAYTGVDLKDESVAAAIAAGADEVVLKPATFADTLAVILGDRHGDVPIPEAGPAGGPADQ